MLTAKRKPVQTKKAKIVKFIPNPEEVKEVNPNRNAKRPKKGEKTYYQNFDFFFKRTSFRTCTLFFKLAYKPFFDKWRQDKKKPDIYDSLIAFVNQEFPGLVETLSQKARFEFIELVKLLVLSHRHNKNDEFLKNPLVDFGVVREPMYNYSKRAKDNFFNMSTYAFIFAWFEASPIGRAFANEKFEENSDEGYPLRMNTEVSLLGKEAIASLKELQMSQPASAIETRKSFMGKPAATQMSK